ncbi:hypothetical protein EVAR_89849_1 [Eumeta japonica]|uniref:Uncharacterized protein n=1 Tax=Eumeta variegata TaxID=151549 RepID=A0A4C1ZW41_EUMVA|nr:hypothetical protein EVAR_89849_1 [Eumeta japonica]
MSIGAVCGGRHIRLYVITATLTLILLSGAGSPVAKIVAFESEDTGWILTTGESTDEIKPNQTTRFAPRKTCPRNTPIEATSAIGFRRSTRHNNSFPPAAWDRGIPGEFARSRNEALICGWRAYLDARPPVHGRGYRSSAEFREATPDYYSRGGI